MASETCAVVIPCFNAAESVQRTIESLVSKGTIVSQIVAVDDGSTDKTLETLHAIAQDTPLTVLTGPNAGGCAARNKGLAEVTAAHVMFLDADDIVDGPIFEGAVRSLKEHTADVALAKMEIRTSDGDVSQQGPFGRPHQDEQTVFENWFDGDWIGTCSVIWRTDFIRKIGGWNESVKVGQDGELMMRALLAGARVAANPEGRGIYFRGRPGSVSMAGGVTRAKLEGQIKHLMWVCEEARSRGWDRRIERNFAALYFLARKAFMASESDLGRQALGFLRSMGHTKHHGTSSHRLLAGIIGLETKVRLLGS